MKNERLIKNIIVGILIFITFWFGLKPLFLGTSYKNYIKLGSREFDFQDNEYAVIIIGSEPEGIASALASARTGLKTLIITPDPDLGSYIQKSMISRMDPQQGLIAKKKTPLNQGIYQEIFGKFDVGFSSTDYVNSVKKLVEAEKSLTVIYESFITEVDIDNDILKGIMVQQPDGRHFYKARNFIDATQDGQLLTLCKTPYFKGSEDLGVTGYYAPLEFNFLVSGVNIDALKKSRKSSDFADEFKMALLAYKKVDPRTKIISPSFIIQNDSELVITGLQIVGAEIEDPKDMEAAYAQAEDEARMLTAFLKTVMVAFKDCTYKGSAEAFFVPEYRHFEGRYRLTVSDILENRDFKDKVALGSEAVDAGRFVDKNTEYIIGKPNVYAIPLRSIIPVNLQNVLMTGSKASFSSLASTSAGSIPTRITVGEAAGLVSAYSFINNVTPAQLLKLSDRELHKFTGFISRGGINLSDFKEDLLIPKTEEKLRDHWAYGYIKSLAEYGLIAGGKDNDFKLDYKSSQELFAVLLKNAVLKLAPGDYNLNFDQVLKPYEMKEPLTGEMAGTIILKTLSITYEKGKALETLKVKGLLPKPLTDRLSPDSPVTMDIVYGLSIETVKIIGSVK